MDRLPSELWNHTCTFLEPPELAAFALVSSTCLIPARWQLYTTLTLKSLSPSVEHTFKLLSADPTLARRVLSLNIDTDPKWKRTYPAARNTWIDLSIFRKMERLKALRFRRLPCIVTDDEEAGEFVNILNMVYENCKSLKEITLSGFWWPQIEDDWLMPPADLDNLLATRPKLTKVIYNARYSSGINWSFLTSSLFTPSSSITYLDLFIGNYVTNTSALCALSFPSLRTLYIRSVQRSGMAPIATFLVSHPSIRHLFLIDVDNYLPLDKLDITMLPRLHTIHAPPLLLAQLAQKCDSLRHVRTLVIDYAAIHSDVEDTAVLVRTVNGFPDLRHCSVSRVITSAKTAEIVRILAVESTQLTCWTGGFYYRDVKQLRLLADALASFPALARLDICEWTYPTSPPTAEQLDALAYVVRKNPTLQKLSLFMTHLPTNEISTMYRVVGRRGAVAGYAPLKETYRGIEGGPYIKERRRVDYSAVEWEDEVLLEDLSW